MNRKSVTVEEIRKRNRRAKKVQRPIAGADLEQIKQKGAKRDTLRLKAKDAALKELEERKVWGSYSGFFTKMTLFYVGFFDKGGGVGNEDKILYSSRKPTVVKR